MTDPLSIPEDLLEAYTDALGGQPPSDDLTRFFDAHPDVHDEFLDLCQVSSLWTDEGDAVHPSPSFFDALHDEVLSQLPPQDASAPETQPPLPPIQHSWLHRLRSWWSQTNVQPVHVFALASACAVVIAVLAFTTRSQDPSTFEPSFASYDPAHNLSTQEREALRSFAHGLDIRLDTTAEVDLNADAEDSSGTAMFSVWDEDPIDVSQEGFGRALDDLKQSL